MIVRSVSVECYVAGFCSSEKKLEFVAGAIDCGVQEQLSELFVSCEWSSRVQFSTFDKCLWQWTVIARVYTCYFIVLNYHTCLYVLFVGLYVFIRVILTRVFEPR